MNFIEINKKGMERFPHLFQPLNIKKITLFNRIYFPPMGLNMCNDDGTISEQMETFYLNLANNGVGLIIMPNTTVSPDSLGSSSYELRMYNERHAHAMKNIVKKIKEKGVVPAIQLNHYGRQGLTKITGKAVIAPSIVPFPSGLKRDPNHSIREMNLQDIEIVKNQFIKAAELCLSAGFEFIQIHASGGQLLNQFLSSYTNRRKDEYNGDIINRAKFPLEVIKGIRKKVGNEIVLSLRISLDDFYSLIDEEGMEPQQYKLIIPLFENAGIDIFMANFGTYDTGEQAMKIKFEKLKSRLYKSTKTVKSFSSKPIGYCWGVKSLETCELLLNKGIADLVGMGRVFLVDNELIIKTLTNREKAIVRCNDCLSCLMKQSLQGIKNIRCINKKQL